MPEADPEGACNAAAPGPCNHCTERDSSGKVMPGTGQCWPEPTIFDIPAGWTAVSRTDPDFEAVAKTVIAGHGWSTFIVAVGFSNIERASRTSTRMFSTYRTGQYREDLGVWGTPGTMNNEKASWVQERESRRFHITAPHTTLLMFILQLTRFES